MKKRGLLLSFIMLVGFSMILAACGGKAQLALVTGGTGGTYYPLGGELANIINDNADAEVTSQSSNASADNMKDIANGDADLAFTQTDIASYAVEGKLMFDGTAVTNAQAIGTLYPETIQIVTLKDSGITSVEDLRGKTVSVGAPGSGTYANAEQILEIHGMTMDDINAQNLAFDESTDGLQDGNIDAAFITAGTPTGAVEGLAALKDVSIVSIAQDKIDALIAKYPYYAQNTIPAGTYKLEAEVATVAVSAMLVVSSELDEDLVYEMTKAIFENTDKISHAKGAFISAENAVIGVGIDFHPGAAKYFKEKGLLN
ncbi:TAXI family TRAP transporter solute-binding subunit [Bacillus luteolus]|uniref:TAXI family TRAP transporter solute-binding subunit n=1 Tax=Litchfieldia luteola TaxID=682179 RepID=A0ABR9QLT2_9BACI|nr:TAXI family TRAP transporter solute-binding subunit [Cytobacillus luteolus]MBE4909455.1 TAXI family TRAP transporter solute-binding subunit [Cytobacillus luteolus]MBP1940855.1 TRAP transporter TAXI family solute receptor [Cytobacillus luteolus]